MTIEQQVHDCISSAVTALGYDIVRVRMLGSAGGTKVLEILIERLDGNHISVGDCSSVSRNISTILDVEEVIDYAYNLEVSSAGVERPLVKLQDFVRFNGYTAQVKLHQAIGGRKKYEGKIFGAEEDGVTMDCGESIKLDFENIKDAKLVLTEELFRKIIK
jgi:ribosome maturation factor RimP